MDWKYLLEVQLNVQDRLGDKMDKIGTAVILAGGKSQRMGFDKQLIEINGKRIIEKTIEQLKNEFDEIIVISNKPELYENLGVTVKSDILKECGPLGGIHSGLTYSKSEYVYFFACDMPIVDIEFIKSLKGKVSNSKNEIIVARDTDFIEPMNGFYSKKLINNIESFLASGEKSLNKFIKMQNTEYILKEQFEKKINIEKVFTNINTKDELNSYIQECQEN